MDGHLVLWCWNYDIRDVPSVVWSPYPFTKCGRNPYHPWQNRIFQVGLLHVDVPCPCRYPWGLIIKSSPQAGYLRVTVEDAGIATSNFLEHPRGLTHWHKIASAYSLKSPTPLLVAILPEPSWVPSFLSWSHFASGFWILVPASNASFFQPLSIFWRFLTAKISNFWEIISHSSSSSRLEVGPDQLLQVVWNPRHKVVLRTYKSTGTCFQVRLKLIATDWSLTELIFSSWLIHFFGSTGSILDPH